MNKEDALILLKQYIKTDTLISHCLAVGAIMKELAYKLNKEPEKWEITGILHDLDYEMTKNNPDIHALKTVEILDDMVDQDIKDAI